MSELLSTYVVSYKHRYEDLYYEMKTVVNKHDIYAVDDNHARNQTMSLMDEMNDSEPSESFELESLIKVIDM